MLFCIVNLSDVWYANEREIWVTNLGHSLSLVTKIDDDPKSLICVTNITTIKHAAVTWYTRVLFVLRHKWLNQSKINRLQMSTEKKIGFGNDRDDYMFASGSEKVAASGSAHQNEIRLTRYHVVVIDSICFHGIKLLLKLGYNSGFRVEVNWLRFCCEKPKPYRLLRSLTKF